MNTTRTTASLLTRCLCIMMVVSPGLVAQTAHEHAPHRVSITALDSLAIETARLAARYKDRAVAMREGYRRVGTDFPGMGEHFVNTRALMSGQIDPAHPTVLSYATIAGTPVLLSYGYMVTTNGDDASATIPGWPDAWHEHSGFLSDESGAGVGHTTTPVTRTRVWVLHIWEQMANPDGQFASDNWVLPFTRAGIAAPANVDADIGRAFSLVVGGDKYLQDVLSDAGIRTASNSNAIDAALSEARAQVEKLAERAKQTGAFETGEEVRLKAVWTTLSNQLRLLLGAAVQPFLEPPHGGKHGAAPPSDC